MPEYNVARQGEYRILTHDITSKSYQALCAALPARGIKPISSDYRYQQGDVVINWGVYGNRGYPIAVNQHDAVRVCCSKQRSYQAFHNNGVHTISSTTDYATARWWLHNGYKVYSRQSDSGCQGEGITVNSNPLSEPDHASYYTRGFNVAREFRIYV